MTKDVKQIRRKYYTLVKGHLMKDSGTINAPIARLQEGIVKRGVRDDGDEAITHYRVIGYQNENTLVECELETGRTHQIRVHLDYLGHPLIGDTLYDEQAMVLEEGHLLHSYYVRLYIQLQKMYMNFKLIFLNVFQFNKRGYLLLR